MKKLSVLLSFCLAVLFSVTSSVSANISIPKSEDEPGLVCTDRDNNGNVSRCWFCNCAEWRKAHAK
jgi:hypothetical protein